MIPLRNDIMALYNNICQKTTFVKNVIHKFGGDSIILWYAIKPLITRKQSESVDYRKNYESTTRNCWRIKVLNYVVSNQNMKLVCRKSQLHVTKKMFEKIT